MFSCSRFAIRAASSNRSNCASAHLSLTVWKSVGVDVPRSVRDECLRRQTVGSVEVGSERRDGEADKRYGAGTRCHVQSGRWHLP